MTRLTDVISFTLVTFTGIFTVVDPIGAVPLFVSLTAGSADADRRRIAARACSAAGLILAGFSLAGGLLFKALGITLPAFKLAGGVLLLLMAIDMLRAQPSRTRSSPEEAAEGEREDVAIFPLATPLLAGPGSIATTMVFMGRSTAWWQAIPVLAAVAATSWASFGLFRSAGRIERVLGRTGMGVLNRILGLILAAIAMQFVLDGLGGAFPAFFGPPRA